MPSGPSVAPTSNTWPSVRSVAATALPFTETLIPPTPFAAALAIPAALPISWLTSVAIIVIAPTEEVTAIHFQGFMAHLPLSPIRSTRYLRRPPPGQGAGSTHREVSAKS